MTDPELLAKKLALIETSVRELRTLSRPAEITTDKLQERFAEHTLQIVSCATSSSIRLDDLLRFVRVIRARLRSDR
ncbi:MAG: hypothetical protein HYR51_13480 [Candidatus Rokubacteria bacterium]|nr:hypothetical protein [Candidatus Rokubacteria bacterium]